MPLSKLLVCTTDSTIPLRNVCDYTLVRFRGGSDDIAELDRSLGLAFVVQAENPITRRQQVRFFLQRGANVNSQDAQGFTALHAAVALADEKLVTLLLARGARTDIRDKVTKGTPLELAAALARQFPHARYAAIADALRRNRV